MLIDKISIRNENVPAMSKKPERWNDPNAHQALRRLYEAHIERTQESQEDFGLKYGIGSQGMVSQYLTGKTPLPLETAAKFARAFGCKLDDISPSLAEQLRSQILPVLAPKGWRRAASIAMLALAVALFAAPQDAKALFSLENAPTVYFVKLQRLILRMLQLMHQLLHSSDPEISPAF